MIISKINRNFEKILLLKKSDNLIYAISKLHSTYRHVENKNYKFLKKIFLIFKYFLLLFDNKNILNSKKKKVDLMIVSNLINLDLHKDYYFGNLEYILRKKKIKSIKIFRNLSNKKTSFFFKNDNSNLNLLSKRADIFRECMYIYYFLKEYFLFKTSGKYNLLKDNLRFFDFFSITRNLRIVDQINDCIGIFKPKCIIFTYEGHAWERLLIQKCKQNNVIAIAHQFSTVTQNQIGIFRNLKNEYNPDCIATSGTITKNLFLKEKLYSKIIHLGSCKFKINKRKNFKQNKILIAFDSDFKRMQEMLELILNYANKNINKFFIIRLHPSSAANFLHINFIRKKIKNVPNIEISNSTLEDNFKKCKFLVYRESSICILGLHYNITPIFFGNDKTLNCFDSKFPKQNIIKHHNELDLILSKKYKNKKYFNNYKKNYFTKLKPNSLIRVINNA